MRIDKWDTLVDKWDTTKGKTGKGDPPKGDTA